MSIHIPFGSSNHPDGQTIRVVSHALNDDGSLWMPGPDIGIDDWPDQVSWANEFAAPGSGKGTVITTGHINYGGTNGAYSDLSEYIDSDIGQTFTVTCDDGRVKTYQITGGKSVTKAELEADLDTPDQPLNKQLYDQDSVFGPDGAPSERFLMISCGGVLDRAAHNYESNIAVFALPVGG